MSDVFISYSRKDQEFVRVLHKALESSNRETWVDWEGIAKGTEWWKEIEEGIEGADTFVFVISPDSVTSEVCQEEINHAVKYNKQILPIVYRDAYELLDKDNSAHRAISGHNWLFFRDTDNFEQSFQELINALNLDIAHVKGHTRFLVRALEWDNKGRKDGFLLKDENLIEAEDWLKLGMNKDPKPTDLQIIYIENSRKIEDANERAIEIIREAHANSELYVQATEAKVFWLENPESLNSLLAALKAGYQLQKLLESNSNVSNIVQWQTKIALQQADQTTKERNRLIGHQSAILSVSYSPDGKTLATASDDNTVKLWDGETGKVLKTLEGHQSSVLSVSYSSDGKTLATASDDKKILIWDTQTGEVLKTLEGHQYSVLSVSYSSDGKTLATASDDKTILIWDVRTLKLLKTLNGHQDRVRSVSYSPDGKTLATASDDNTVKLWDGETGKAFKTLEGHQSWVLSVSFSPDGKTLATASADKTVKLWDIATGKELKTLKGHQGWVNRVSYSPDGKTLASADNDGKVILWNFDLDKLMQEGCNWVRPYLASHPNETELRQICNVTD